MRGQRKNALHTRQGQVGSFDVPYMSCYCVVIASFMY